MSTRSHSCVFFDDGDLHTCGCGHTAVLVTEDDGSTLLVVLDGADPFAALPSDPVPVSVVDLSALAGDALLVSA